MAAGETTLRSGKLAQLTGVSPDTVRHYERMGVLPESPRTSSGYRMYGRDAIDRIRLVQRALQLGFTLSELSEILRARDSGGVPCHRVLDLAEGKLRSLDKQIRELRQIQRYMRQLIGQWRAKLKRTGPDSRAMLLHTLTDKPVPLPTPTNNFRRRKS